MTAIEHADWLRRRVRLKATGRVGTVTADLSNADADVLAVWFGPGEWNVYRPNAHAKAELFELVDGDEADGARI